MPFHERPVAGNSEVFGWVHGGAMWFLGTNMAFAESGDYASKPNNISTPGPRPSIGIESAKA
jgi:hypothetical protein